MKYGILLVAMVAVFVADHITIRNSSLFYDKPTIPAIESYDRVIHGRLTIRRVRREGAYEAVLRSPAFSAAMGIMLRVNQYDLVAGCELEVVLSGRGRLQALPENGYGRYLVGRGIQARLKLSRRYHVIATDCSRATMGGQMHATLRAVLIQFADLDYQDPRYGVVLGLVLGNSGFLQRDLKSQARRLGILHLFAASGLHMGIFYACLYWPLTRWFGKRDPRALFAPLVMCLIYLLALDVPVSLLRAFCFLTSHAAQSLFHRHVPIRELLVNTALAVLVLAPHEFYQIGTALSFGAVGGILYFSRILRQTIFTSRRWKLAGDHAAISLAAGVCTVPLIVVFFEQHPALSLPANVLLVPLVGVLLPLIVATLFCTILIAHLPGSIASIDLTAAPTDIIALSLSDAFSTWIWWPLLSGLDGFLILTEILAYIDDSLIPRALRDAGGWRCWSNVRVLPLAANLLIMGSAFWLRCKQVRAKRGGRLLDSRRTRLVQFWVWSGVALLGPPGAWLEYWILLQFAG